MANRHLSRSIVLQTLFEWDFSFTEGKDTPNSHASDIQDILKKNLKEFAPGLEDDEFLNDLLNQVLKKKNLVDEIIVKAAPEWPISKISVVDRNILRIGLTELLFGDREKVPPKVAINEAIELAKTFGGEKSSKFVNGVLGAVYKELGEPDKEHVSRKMTDVSTKENLDSTSIPVENLGGALIYSKNGDNILFAFVHDVFGYWTLSKGKLESGEDIQEGTKRKIKEEIGLDITIQEKLGENEYVATHPEKGKILKKVVYFLAESPYQDLVLEKSGGLDGARWFTMAEVSVLRVYKDIVLLITKAVDILNKNSKSN